MKDTRKTAARSGRASPASKAPAKAGKLSQKQAEISRARRQRAVAVAEMEAKEKRERTPTRPR